MRKLPTLRIRGLEKEVAIVQGGMGAGVSLAKLAGAVAQLGGTGIVSTVALDLMVSSRLGKRVSHREAARIEVLEAKRLSNGSGLIGINAMALMHTYEESVIGALEADVDALFVGAGLPMNLAKLASGSRAMLVPIVSSARALGLICHQWQRYDRLPDAVILEGPLAGGHLGFKIENINDSNFQLEEILPPVLETARAYGFPVIVAGGIWNREDIIRWVNAGADGVQLGTRFLATEESGASKAFKQAVIETGEEDIIVAANPSTPASPSGMPFRITTKSPAWAKALLRQKTRHCSLGYMLPKGKDGNNTCPALINGECFCICEGLYGAAGFNPERSIYTMGTNAARVDRIVPVKELMQELTGI